MFPGGRTREIETWLGWKIAHGQGARLGFWLSRGDLRVRGGGGGRRRVVRYGSWSKLAFFERGTAGRFGFRETSVYM